MSLTCLGQGYPALVVQSQSYVGPDLLAEFREDDIRRPTDWKICDSRNVLIIHLTGEMTRLETEVNGRGQRHNPPIPGQVWTIPAGSRYASHACGRSIQYLLLTLDSTFPLRQLAGHQDRFLHAAALEMSEALGNTDNLSKMLIDSLGRTMSTYIRRKLSDDRKSYDRSSRSWKAALLHDYIHNRLPERITLRELIDLSLLQERQVQKLFRDVFGLSPSRYILLQRLKRALELLGNSSADLSSIALDCGFCSHSHLTSAFKSQFGYTPSQYRTRLASSS